MYKIGITSYDNDHQLFETHLGTDVPDGGELLYSVWGKTEQESKDAAKILKFYLVQFMKDVKMRVVEVVTHGVKMDTGLYAPNIPQSIEKVSHNPK